MDLFFWLKECLSLYICCLNFLEFFFFMFVFLCKKKNIFKFLKYVFMEIKVLYNVNFLSLCVYILNIDRKIK